MMKRNLIYLTLGTLILVIIFFSFFFRGDSESLGVVNNTVGQDELTKHNAVEDCWVAYKGKVYDVTSWLPNHPGSAGAISPFCGTAEEFEEAFTRKHGTSKAGMLMQVARLMGDFEVKGNLG